MKQFNFTKYIMYNKSQNYLSYFEWELLLSFYRIPSQDLRKPHPLISKLRKTIKNFIVPYLFQFTQLYNKISSDTVIYESYFAIKNMESELNKIGFKVTQPPWRLSKNGYDSAIYKISTVLKENVDKGLNSILSEDFQNLVELYMSYLYKYYKNSNIKAIILPYDLPANEKISIEIFKKLNKPSFIFLHGGMPAHYTTHRFNTSDYLMVWGDEHKKNYIKEGFNEDKIIVTGHPYYQKIVDYVEYRFDLKNILVLSKPPVGGQKTDKIILQDLANSLLYLYMIEDVLKSIGISNVRLRLHQSDDICYYENNINTDFYKFDKNYLKKSLSESSLIIGPGSTVFLEALCYGVNYVIFEPSIDGIGMNNYKLCTPLIGDDPEIPVANSTNELKYILKLKISVNPNVLKKYMKTPFNLNAVKKIIDQNY